jgi:cytochrome c peroxidase
LPAHLDQVDRGIAQGTFDRIAQTIAAYEESEEVNPFSSKYDYVLAGKAKFTAQEQIGYALFRGTATHCNECHRDGGPGEEPLFTDLPHRTWVYRPTLEYRFTKKTPRTVLDISPTRMAVALWTPVWADFWKAL